MYGAVTINGKNYIEREQTFPLEVAVTVNGSIQSGQVVLPGVADFWLKALIRDTVVTGASAARRFRFRLGNTDGSTWYSAGGIGGTTDRVLDINLFGTGQFPKIVVPHIFYSSSAGIKWEIEDVSQNQPYTVIIAFEGSYLLPV